MTQQEKLLQNTQELRALCARSLGTEGTFKEVCSLVGSIADLSASPAIAASALDVRFKAEDLFHRPHLLSEAILRLMLEDRLQRLDALIRASGSSSDRRAPGQRGRRASDRITVAALRS
jgi:hypothetical protein